MATQVFGTAAAELVQTAEEAEPGLCTPMDYSRLTTLQYQLRKDLHNTTGHLDPGQLGQQVGPAQLVADALVLTSQELGLRCLHKSGIRQAIRQAMAENNSSESDAVAAVRAVGDHAVAAAAKWEEAASAKAMKAALDRSLRRDTGDGGRYRDLRRQEPREAPRQSNEVVIKARRLQRELGGREQVCYTYIETGAPCRTGCSRLPCNGKAGPQFEEVQKRVLGKGG